jgi:medium-chain acyl-[acyl-carrier-protein] hydrolase
MTMPSWFVCPRPNPEADIRLFCFPYGGGGIPVFRGWAEALPGVELWVLSLPGRWSRLQERPLTDLPALVEELETALRPLAGDRFVFFGHSLGARVAFELARLLRRRERPLPLLLMVSASSAPQCPASDPPLHTLPREAFIAALRARHALLDEVLAHQELLDVVLPYLLADFTLLETAVYVTEPPLTCPITAFGGAADVQVGADELAAWSAQTSSIFTQKLFPGDHLFLHTSQVELLNEIGRILRKI